MWPQAETGPREAALMVIRTCQYARWGSADKFQIVSIADERSAEDARGVMLELLLLNKSHLPSSSRLSQAGKTLPLSAAPTPHPSAYLHPTAPLTPSCLPWLSRFAC